MRQSNERETGCPLELWGGLECTINRVGDNFFSQLDRNGHPERLDDLERFQALGISAIRYPVLWERTAPNGLDSADWNWTDQTLPRLKALGIEPIVGLVHHGSGPAHTSLADANFAPGLATYARAVAERYPWVELYTPVNEPLTTARFSGLYGIWYPHGRDDRTFVECLINECRATVLAMREIRAVNPMAKLVQTDDLGKTYATPNLAELAAFYNERRWLAWDLLCGRVDDEHPMWDYLAGTGIATNDILWFKDNPCPPDIIGVNYYVTSERVLDDRADLYPEDRRASYKGVSYADTEAARVLTEPTAGIGPLLMETWERYHLPIAVTEVHLDAHRDGQMRWLYEVWQAAIAAREAGADLRAVTVWSLLGSYDWNCLVTACHGYYEPGPLDLRGPTPRPTALAGLMQDLSAGRPPRNPAAYGQGWWRRPERLLWGPVELDQRIVVPRYLALPADIETPPILITGGRGTLAQALARVCEERGLKYRLVSRQELDIADPASVERALDTYQPWAVINTAGYVRVDDAELEPERCFRENTTGPAMLAQACARHKIRFVTFSTDMVFDGRQMVPYAEASRVAPLNVYGKSKAEAEQRVLDCFDGAMVVRTSSFFGPWDQFNFLHFMLEALTSGRSFAAAGDLVISPTYVPDLAHNVLDLMIDGEQGIWHLTHDEAVSWAELAQRAAVLAGMDGSRIEVRSAHEMPFRAKRPLYSAMTSQRASVMPSLDDALARFITSRPVADMRRSA